MAMDPFNYYMLKVKFAKHDKNMIINTISGEC